MTRKSGFRNIKLGKNVYRQAKRRGTRPPVPKPVEPRRKNQVPDRSTSDGHATGERT